MIPHLDFLISLVAAALLLAHLPTLIAVHTHVQSAVLHVIHALHYRFVSRACLVFLNWVATAMITALPCSILMELIASLVIWHYVRPVSLLLIRVFHVQLACICLDHPVREAVLLA